MNPPMPISSMAAPGIVTHNPSTSPFASVAAPSPMAKGQALAWGR